MLNIVQRDGIKMKITERQLRNLVRKALITEIKKEDERVVFDPEDVSLPMNRRVKKFLDPEMHPLKKQKFEAEIDSDGTVQQQAQALAAKAITYADKAPKESMKLMSLSRSMLQRMMKNMDSVAAEESEESTGVSSKIIDYLATSK